MIKITIINTGKRNRWVLKARKLSLNPEQVITRDNMERTIAMG